MIKAKGMRWTYIFVPIAAILIGCAGSGGDSHGANRVPRLERADAAGLESATFSEGQIVGGLTYNSTGGSTGTTATGYISYPVAARWADSGKLWRRRAEATTSRAFWWDLTELGNMETIDTAPAIGSATSGRLMGTAR